MFNTERLPKSERSLTMTTARANYFLNPNMLVTAGISTFSRKFESYDDGMGKPGSLAMQSAGTIHHPFCGGD